MKLVTANRLTDGVVLWLTEAGEWSTRVEDAARFEPEAATAAVAAADFRSVVGAYVIEADGEFVEKREILRETIRSGGPSVGHSVKKNKAVA